MFLLKICLQISSDGAAEAIKMLMHTTSWLQRTAPAYYAGSSFRPQTSAGRPSSDRIISVSDLYCTCKPRLNVFPDDSRVWRRRGTVTATLQHVCFISRFKRRNTRCAIKTLQYKQDNKLHLSVNYYKQE